MLNNFANLRTGLLNEAITRPYWKLADNWL